MAAAAVGAPAVPAQAGTDDRLDLAPVPGVAMPTLPYDPDPPVAIAPERPPFRQRNRIVYAFDQPIRSRLALSAELSDACRRGAFIQRVEFLYRAFGPDERPLGVAFGTRAINLVDPGRLRAAGMVYFFEDQEAGRCRVYTASQDALKPFFVPP